MRPDDLRTRDDQAERPHPANDDASTVERMLTKRARVPLGQRDLFSRLISACGIPLDQVGGALFPGLPAALRAQAVHALLAGEVNGDLYVYMPFSAWLTPSTAEELDQALAQPTIVLVLDSDAPDQEAKPVWLVDITYLQIWVFSEEDPDLSHGCWLALMAWAQRWLAGRWTPGGVDQ